MLSCFMTSDGDNLPWYAWAVLTAITILACFGAANIIMLIADWLGKLRYCADCRKKRFSQERKDTV